LLAYQVVRETLTNAVKHSGASQVSFSVHVVGDDGEWIRVVVEDDGCGFQPDEVDKDTHFGLQLLAERVDAVGGRFRVATDRGGGTRIEVELALDSRRE